MSTLVIVEHHHGAISANARQLLGAAQFLSKPIHVLVAGEAVQSVASEIQTWAGVDKIYRLEHAALAHGLPEVWAPMIQALASDYVNIIAAASTFGKNILPRVAAGLGVSQVSEVLRIVSADTFERPMYAGNVIATVQSLDPLKILTIRTSVFEPVALASTSAPIESLTYTPVEQTKAKFVSQQENTSARPELTHAEVIVSGGRALKDAENFERWIGGLADVLGAAVGASRAAVDAGFVPNDYQVGQTGKIVAPRVYIAIGISGAVQHVAGMSAAKTIIAINKDPDAPIFQIADYGFVGDIFEILPALITFLQGK
ncbi:MAG: electron transfer flavoprotein subunit alpha/FixB family protein [Legionellaceae bacterium]|nr:electron transfer flavoprotein subunit alpha/FixB family protein [Legionellaceae bacterium]